MNAIGRFSISAIFVITGITHILHWREKSAGLGAKGIPFPDFFLACAVVLMVGGGILLLTGRHTRWAVIALLVFMVPTTLLYHNFWAVAPADYQNQLIQFLKNLAIMGGLVLILFPEKR